MYTVTGDGTLVITTPAVPVTSAEYIAVTLQGAGSSVANTGVVVLGVGGK